MFLAIFRIILVLLLLFIICVFGIIYCLFKPRKPEHTAIFGYLFGSMAPIFGLKVEVRNMLRNHLPRNCVYIANHQNYYDMVTVSYAVPSRTITVGKKSLSWIPLFGQLYWLSGNILIDRSDNVLVRKVLIKIAKSIKINDVSILFFPEGTRNHGKGLLPFKTGAFYTALIAKVPIVPICVSNISNGKVKLNRWSNGLVIIEIMYPINILNCKFKQIRQITEYCHSVMTCKFNELNKEVINRETR